MNCSEYKAMLVQLHDQFWLHLVRHLLSEVVAVESRVLSAQEISSVFVIVNFQVADESWSHMSVIRAWSDSWEHH